MTDVLPQTTIAYMDPIFLPPTRNYVVQEIMIRSVKIAQETNRRYAVVTYDLAIALNAYCVQALQSPTFDNLIILLGNFHLELVGDGSTGRRAEVRVETLLFNNRAIRHTTPSRTQRSMLPPSCLRQ